ncbi:MULTISPECIES: hypothetical protein [Nocardiopsis]|uniref:Uncharacterized protein n=1 Tax=Nocardiopsis lambiniae TaxID=3075539 RepID=A0ABU2MBT4_9ACTN|nr:MULTISPECIES: hypothetical protein [unclassified Nocardiopsis]MDE3725192.1 hypothetical protein [Nocardiopsis sp. N85]MDT0329391.1 hypothetical protein [Nocardiopsis sp. DSM 44743]
MSVTLDPRRLPHHRPDDREHTTDDTRQPVVLGDALADVMMTLSSLDPDLAPALRLGEA